MKVLERLNIAGNTCPTCFKDTSVNFYIRWEKDINTRCYQLIDKSYPLIFKSLIKFDDYPNSVSINSDDVLIQHIVNNKVFCTLYFELSSACCNYYSDIASNYFENNSVSLISPYMRFAETLRIGKYSIINNHENEITIVSEGKKYGDYVNIFSMPLKSFSFWPDNEAELIDKLEMLALLK